MDTVHVLSLPFGGFCDRQAAATVLSRLLGSSSATIHHHLARLAAASLTIPPRYILAELTPAGVEVWPHEPSDAPPCFLRKGG